MAMVAPLVLYLAVSMLFFGTTQGFATHVFGYGGDSFTSVWCLGWWPWSILHGLNPFVTHKVWYPEGIDLTWVTSIPSLALIGLPVTLLGGAIVTYNTLSMLAPAAAAWAAFLLARHVTRDTAAALFAGYLYGFSSYEFANVLGHLNLATTCVVPLLLLICLKRLAGELSRPRCIALLTLAMVVQFGISLEIFCTSCVFGSVAWLVFLPFVSGGRRQALGRLAVEWAASLLMVLALASPFLYFLLRGMRHLPPTLNEPGIYSADPLNYLIPTVLTSFGNAYFASVSGRFTGGLAEQSAYLGLPVILILTAFFARRLAAPGIKALLIMVLLLVLCSFGPGLWLDGTRTGLWLPWAWADNIPLLRSALPNRFTLYVTLLAGLIVSFWLAEYGSGIVRARRFVLATAACLFLLPNRAATGNWASAQLLPFFDQVGGGALLRPNQNVLLLPFGVLGANMIWQWQAGYRFSQSAGYTGLIPPSEAAEPVVGALNSGQIVPGLGRMILAYCRARGVSAIIAGPDTAPALMDVLQKMGWPSRRQQGVVMFSDPAVDPR